MTHLDDVEEVRTKVRTIFAELGDTAGRWQETILIRDGHYCGRRFQGDELQAIWFVEENELKFYGVDGTVVRSCPPLGDPPQHKIVA